VRRELLVAVASGLGVVLRENINIQSRSCGVMHLISTKDASCKNHQPFELLGRRQHSSPTCLLRKSLGIARTDTDLGKDENLGKEDMRLDQERTRRISGFLKKSRLCNYNE
jgi:hypothetical protein